MLGGRNVSWECKRKRLEGETDKEHLSKKFAKSVSSCWGEVSTRYDVSMCRLLNHVVFAAGRVAALKMACVLAAATEGESAVERHGVTGMVKCSGPRPVTVALVRFGNRRVLSRPAQCVFCPVRLFNALAVPILSAPWARPDHFGYRPSTRIQTLHAGEAMDVARSACSPRKET